MNNGTKNQLVSRIMRAAAEHYGYTVDDLVRDYRHASLVKARHAAMWLAREFAKASYPELGIAFCRDHTTIMVACRKMQQRLKLEAINGGSSLLNELFNIAGALGGRRDGDCVAASCSDSCSGEGATG